MLPYTIPDNTRIGHIHLKVADLNRALAFYRDLLGFTVTTMYGDQAAFISAGGYHHHIGLNTLYSKICRLLRCVAPGCFTPPFCTQRVGTWPWRYSG